MTRVRPFVLAIAVLSSLLVGGCAEDEGAEKEGAEKDDTAAPSSSPEATDPLGGEAWIAYQTDRTGDEGVWLVHPDGTDDHQVMTDLPSALLPDWSPDGTPSGRHHPWRRDRAPHGVRPRVRRGDGALRLRVPVPGRRRASVLTGWCGDRLQQVPGADRRRRAVRLLTVDR